MKSVEWEGDSLDVIRAWPEAVKANIGADLRRLQKGDSPRDWKPFPGLRRKAFELRDRDKDGFYRLVYVTVIKEKLYVLHCFKKKSGKASQKDVSTTDERLKQLLKRETKK